MRKKKKNPNSCHICRTLYFNSQTKRSFWISYYLTTAEKLRTDNGRKTPFWQLQREIEREKKTLWKYIQVNEILSKKMFKTILTQCNKLKKPLFRQEIHFDYTIVWKHQIHIFFVPIYSYVYNALTQIYLYNEIVFKTTTTK